jgi:hypothetical protein
MINLKCISIFLWFIGLLINIYYKNIFGIFICFWIFICISSLFINIDRDDEELNKKIIKSDKRDYYNISKGNNLVLVTIPMMMQFPEYRNQLRYLVFKFNKDKNKK